MIWTMMLLSILVTETPQQLEKDLEEIAHMDCNEFIETIERQCMIECRGKAKKNKTMQKQCMESCSGKLGDFKQGCSEMQKQIKEFKKKSKSEREEILQQAIEDDKNHKH